MTKSAMFPVLTPRGELSVALKRVWPGSFQVSRQRHGFGITLAHAALPGSVTLAITDDELVGEPEAVVRGLTRQAWGCLLAFEQKATAQGDPGSRKPVAGSPKRIL